MKVKKWGELTLVQKIIGSVGTVFLLLILLGIFLPGEAPQSEESTESIQVDETNKKYDLKGRAISEELKVGVENQNDFDWNDCRITLNDDYHYEMDLPIQAGGTYDWGYAAFTKDNGEKFNPSTHEAKRIFVYCKDPNGDFISGMWEW